ncbi:sigma E protease regulator RseP [Candidatus Sororendozoicomonas aggregata]|uniref:sigma E protease regulator RseP n=1 Tax=Candidatus Sororendozoicomonas aggregata TaxID=3073239 RepID=UPI002ED3895A
MILDTIQTVVAFLITLGVLVSIHEYGHFWVARRCGVKVLRFSIGFGKPLWQKKDRHGTEFSLAAIPLGGYVKMLDEREGPVSADEKHLSFNSQSVLSRIAIVVAGPVANFLLAIVALWLMYLVGVRTVAPQVGEVIPGSPAAMAGIEAGDEIVAVDGVETKGWQAVNMALVSALGETKTLRFSVLPGEPGAAHTGGTVVERNLSVKNWLAGDENPAPLLSLGIRPYTPVIPAIIGSVVDGGAAARSGLKVGDKIVQVDGQPLSDWSSWVKWVRNHPDQVLAVTVVRGEKLIQLSLRPDTRSIDGIDSGYIGAGVHPVSWPPSMIRTLQYGPVTALVKGAEGTWALTTMTVNSLWKMVVGLVSVTNLSGPITIAKVAGASMASGFENFLYFLGMLSVSLGVLNLLPIPVLDGGHLFFYLVELVRGRPLSERVQLLGLKIGVSLVICVMGLAIYNDVSRLF